MSEETIEVRTEPYTYDSLHEDGDEIRLLRVRPVSSIYDMIECSLHVVKLDDAPQYVVAESTKTDNSSDNRVLLCEGHVISVAVEVYFWIQYLSRLGWQWMWMKEVCVGSNNPEEDAQLRPAIYLHAAGCFKSLPPLVYPALVKPDQIRLLELHPPHSKNLPLRYQFRVVSLKDCPVFQLLDVLFPMPETITQEYGLLPCDNQALRVTMAVYNALESLRSSAQITIWVEDVCVNQDDPKDKIHHDALRETIRDRSSQRLLAERPPFQYRSLESANNETRLIRVHPAISSNAPLFVEVFTVSLDDKPNYVALSYIWGSSEKNCCVICVDGSMIRITMNLFMALNGLRQQSFQFVWADQISINQEDVQERSQQVARMSRIYRQAKSVVVHLVPTPTVKYLDNRHQTWFALVRILSLTRRVLEVVRPDAVKVEEAEFSKFGIPPLNHNAWTSWRTLRAHPWFSRGWIIQEVASNAKVWVICCRCLVSWRDLQAANDAVQDERIPNGLVDMADIAVGRNIFHNYNHLRKPSGLAPYSLIDLMSVFRDAQTTDPKDKIYALRGIAKDAEDTPTPNYAKSARDVFLEFGRYFILQGRGIDLICEAGFNKASLELPSWIAHWKSDQGVPAYNYGLRGGPFQKCLGHPSHSQEPTTGVLLTNDPMVITVKGAIVDTIFGITLETRTVSSPNVRIDDSIMKFLDFDAAACEQLEDFDKRRCAYGETLKKAYAETLIGGVTGFDDPLVSYQDTKSRIRTYLELENRSITDFPMLRYFSAASQLVERRRFGTTHGGYMALFPLLAAEGDHICIFQGHAAAFVVRKIGNAHVLIGDSYIHELIKSGSDDMGDLCFEDMLLK